MTLTEAQSHASQEAVAIAVGLTFNRLFGPSEASRLIDIASKAQQLDARGGNNET